MSSVLQVIGIMPLKKNVPHPRTADWKLKTCPECGRECWYPTNNAKLVLRINPDMEDEVEQIMCVVESAPRVAPEGVRPVAHIAWRKRPKQFVVYDPVPTNECLYDGKPVYTQRVLQLEEYTVPFCSNCDHRLDDCAGSFCPVCGSIIEERRRT